MFSSNYYGPSGPQTTMNCQTKRQGQRPHREYDHHSHRHSSGAKRGYVRLDSLEGHCKMMPSSDHRDSVLQVDSKKPPSKQESKWFSHYQHTDPHNNRHHRTQSYHHTYYNYETPTMSSSASAPTMHHHHHQVPYNLTKGQYEFWHMEPVSPDQPHLHQPVVRPVVDNPQNWSYSSYMASYLPSNWTRTVSSLMGGICHWMSSQPPEQDMAAENHTHFTPTSSTPLNPNAKEFTPLNPLAKEFHPSNNCRRKLQEPEEIVAQKSAVCQTMATKESSDDEMPQKEALLETPKVPEDTDTSKEDKEDCVTPEMMLQDESLKSVNARKCTPWIPPKCSSNDESMSSCDDNISRDRLLSTCSEDSSIQFCDSPEAAKQSRRRPSCEGVNKVDKEKCSPFLKNFLADSDSDDEDEDEDDEDEDGDWDATVDAIFIDDEELLKECGLQCQWINPINRKSTEKDDHEEEDEAFETEEEEEERTPAFDSYPLAMDHEEAKKRVQAANQKWAKVYNDDLDMSGEEEKSVVHFAQPEVTDCLYEDPCDSADLRSARVSDLARRKADKERYERLMAPVFSQEHRSKVWQRLHKQ